MIKDGLIVPDKVSLFLATIKNDLWTLYRGVGRIGAND